MWYFILMYFQGTLVLRFDFACFLACFWLKICTLWCRCGRMSAVHMDILWCVGHTYTVPASTVVEVLNLMFVDPCIIVQFIKKSPTRCNNVSKFYYSIFIWSSTCFGRHTAHHQEPKTALAASGFAYVEGCWTCSCCTLSGTYTYCVWQRPPTTCPNNLPRTKNQRLPVQF